MMRARKSRGFTLVEALAAIAVMVIVIPILLQGFSIAGSIAEQARQTADATSMAQSRLDEMMATQQYDNSTTEEIINGTTFTCTSEQDSYESEVDVNQLAVTVAWNSRGNDRKVTLTTLVFIPESTSQTTTPGALP